MINFFVKAQLPRNAGLFLCLMLLGCKDKRNVQNPDIIPLPATNSIMAEAKQRLGEAKQRLGFPADKQYTLADLQIELEAQLSNLHVKEKTEMELHRLEQQLADSNRWEDVCNVSFYEGIKKFNSDSSAALRKREK